MLVKGTTGGKTLAILWVVALIYVLFSLPHLKAPFANSSHPVLAVIKFKTETAYLYEIIVSRTAEIANCQNKLRHDKKSFTYVIHVKDWSIQSDMK